MNKEQKRTFKVYCPRNKKVHLLFKADFVAKDEIAWDCSCGEHHTLPKDEDVSQAAARIVKEATKD